MPTNKNRVKLRALIAAKTLVRGNLDNAYQKLDEYQKLRKRLTKGKKDTSRLDVQIQAIETELNKLEESIANAPVTSSLEAGSG